MTVRRDSFVPLIALLGTVTAAIGQTFTPLGDLDSQNRLSAASGVSADGSVVVGGSYIFDPTLGAPAMHAIRWTASTGMLDLGLVSGAGLRGTLASRVSSDGSVIAGSRGFTSPSGFEGRNAAYWTVSGGQTQSHLLVDGDTVGYTAADLSANGSVIVGGTRFNGPLPVPDSAYRYDTTTGTYQVLGYLPGGNFSQATAVSADGSIIVGYGSTPAALGAFRYTSQGGMQLLTGGAPGVPSEAHGISADGNVIVGQYDSQAMRWTAAAGFLNLGALPEGGSTLAEDVSANGSRIVGYDFIQPGVTIAFLWDETHGMRKLSDALANDYGLSLPGWTLSDASGISDDGLTIVGTGINPEGEQEGWVVHVPSPGTGVAMIGLVGCLLRRRRGR